MNAFSVNTNSVT